MIPKPRALLFDWDGTLVDNWPVIHRALNDTLVHFNREPWTLAETMERISRSQRDSFPLLFGDKWEAARDRFYQRFTERHLRDLVVLPGAAALLEALSVGGLWMGVVSNKRGDFLRRESTHLRWDHFFGRIVGANDALEDKPSAAPVRLVLEGTPLELNREIWFIGDSATDVQTAHNAGCTAVLVNQPGGNPTPLPEKLKPHFSLDGLPALGDLVRSRLQSI